MMWPCLSIVILWTKVVLATDAVFMGNAKFAQLSKLNVQECEHVHSSFCLDKQGHMTKILDVLQQN